MIKLSHISTLISTMEKDQLQYSKLVRLKRVSFLRTHLKDCRFLNQLALFVFCCFVS